MKKSLIAFALLASQSVFANNIEVNATAYRIDMNLRLYEICGAVTGTTNFDGMKVDIVVDPGKHEGHYVTALNSKGQFCQVVRIAGNSVNVVVESSANSSQPMPLPKTLSIR